MRRIYESSALRRETGPFTPNERRDDKGPSPPDSDSTGLLDYVVPDFLRRRAITISVSTPEDVYAVDQPVPFQIELFNRMPFSISIETPTPLLWSWEVNGIPEASHVPQANPPEQTKRHTFKSGERKRFVKRWPQRFRVSPSEWERAEPGRYTVRSWLNVDASNEDPPTSEAEFEISDAIDPE